MATEMAVNEQWNCRTCNTSQWRITRIAEDRIELFCLSEECGFPTYVEVVVDPSTLVEIDPTEEHLANRAAEADPEEPAA